MTALPVPETQTEGLTLRLTGRVEDPGLAVLLRGQPGVVTARVDAQQAVANLRIQPPATPAALVAALAAAGVGVQPQSLVLAVEGMTCGACTGRVERVLKAQPGVAGAVANLALRRVQVSLWDAGDAARSGALAAAVTKAGYAAVPLEQAAPADPVGEEHALWRRAALAAGLTLPVVVLEMAGHLWPALHHRLAAAPLWPVVQFLLVTAVLAGPGRGFFARGFRTLWQRRPDMNALVALGAGSAWAFSTLVAMAPAWLPANARGLYFEAAAVIVTLILVGRALEQRVRGQAGAAISRLVALQPRSARLEDGHEVPVEALRPGQRLLLRPGERVPADGLVVSGTSALDEAMLTGEPQPQPKGPGDVVSAGTINGTGGLTVEVTASGTDTRLHRIAALVAAAQGGRLPAQALVDRITGWFVPAVMVMAAVTVALWLLFGPGLAEALVAGVSVLIIACPCAMGLATPVSVLVGTGRAAELGVLFREGEALQRLAGVRSVAFDKTGTLTLGRPRVVQVQGDVLALAAAVEAQSEHPLALAVLAAAAEAGLKVPAATGFAAVPGQGARAIVSGAEVTVGSAALLGRVPPDLAQVAEAAAGRGCSVIFVAVDHEVRGLIAVADPLRPEAAAAVAQLSRLGLSVTMISGDTPRAAGVIAAEVGIDAVHGGVSPEGKLDLVRALPEAAFVGDGINDAPALAAASVGIAMGTGSDVAIEAGDVVVMRGNPLGVVDAVRMARATLANIRQNLVWAFGYNVALIPVAAGALVPFGGPQISPMLAAGAMALSSVFVLGNALRLRRVKGAKA